MNSVVFQREKGTPLDEKKQIDLNSSKNRNEVLITSRILF